MMYLPHQAQIISPEMGSSNGIPATPRSDMHRNNA
jgi:hypothetical protein